MSLDTVGTLLAAIANLLQESLQLLRQSDTSLWGADEHEQVRVLEETLDEAKKDFQELSPLVKGQLYYQNDRQRTCGLPRARAAPLATHPQPMEPTPRV